MAFFKNECSYSENVTQTWPRVKRRELQMSEACGSKTAGATCGRNVQEPTRERYKESVYTRASRLHHGLLERERTASSTTGARLAAKREDGNVNRELPQLHQQGAALTSGCYGSSYPYLASAGMVSSLQADKSSSAIILQLRVPTFNCMDILKVERA